MKYRSRLAVSASLLAMAVPIDAGRAADAAPAAADAVLEEIVISAQKRTEKLSDTTVTATVLTGDALDHANLSDISDVNKMIAAVNLNGSFNGRVPLGIRGVSSDSNESAVGIASGVGIDVDGVPVPSDSFAANDIEDVTSIDVLEGPQATLGGRTATSGVIHYVTHQPTDFWRGGIEGTVTDDNEHHVVGDISGPIADRVSMSLVGWGHYTEFPIRNITYDANSHDDEYGARAKLKFKITDDFDATLVGRLSASKSAGGNFAYTYVYPGAYLLAGANGGPPFWSQAALFPGSIHFSAHNTDYASPVADIFQHSYDADLGVNLEYRLGDLTLTSTTAYQHETRQSRQDLFAVNEYFGDVGAAALHAPSLAFNNMQTEYVNVGQLSEELKVASPIDQPFNYIAGVFYSDTQVHLNQIRLFIPALDHALVNPDTATTAIYGHMNWKFLENTTLVGGLRYNYDQLSYNINQFGFAPVYTPLQSAGSSSSGALVGDIGLKQQITPRMQIYATYTRGYAPAAYNTAFTLVPGQVLTPVAQETINSYEIGTYGAVLDGALRFHADLFDTIYDNYQVSTYINVEGATAGILDLSAAGQAETQGAELSGAWKPFAETTLSLNGALIRAQFNKYLGGPCWWGGPVNLAPGSCYYDATSKTLKADLSGKPLPNSPKLKLTVGLDQSVPLGSLPFELDFGGTLTYRSKAEMQPDQNPEAVQSGYALLNLHATVRPDEGDYSLTLFVDNVTNTHYNVDVEDFWNSPWGSNAIVVQPARDTNRYFGAKLAAQF